MIIVSTGTALMEQLLNRFRMEDHVPAGHLLRQVGGFLDFSSLREEIAPLFSHTGRPSIDSELLVGYCFGIQSERRLCDEVHLHLAYRSFL